MKTKLISSALSTAFAILLVNGLSASLGASAYATPLPISGTYKVLSVNNGFCIEHNLYTVAFGKVGSVLQVSMDSSGVSFTDPSLSSTGANVDSYPVGTVTQGIEDDSGELIETGSFIAANIFEQNVHGKFGSDPGDIYFVRVTNNGQSLTYESGDPSGLSHTCLMTLVSPQ